jgi:EAL domain-containing protein (putative c-di-GMP-specific phosphodiesterase class I)
MSIADRVGSVAQQHQSFRLVYQPIVHLDTGAIAGVEALCRFHDGRSPERWFQECERAGTAAALDLAIIERALEELGKLPEGYLAVNLSPSTLRDPRLPELLQAPGVPTERIVVEVTEHARVADYMEAQRVLGTLRRAGVRVAVDDAGAGYSTFRHILQLRPDIIKMDQSITRDIDTDPARRALATALVIFAGEVGASLVAEGVETEGELRAVQEAGINRVQGFVMSAAQTPPLAALAYVPREQGFEPGTLEAHTWIDLDATVAITAHGLLSSLAAIETALSLLRQRHTEIPEDEFRAIVHSAERQAHLVTGVLKDLVRGLPAGTLAVLEELNEPAL